MLASVCIPPLATRVLPVVALCAIVGLNTVGETHFGLPLSLSTSKRLSGVVFGPKAAPETHFDLTSSLRRVEVALSCGCRAKNHDGSMVFDMLGKLVIPNQTQTFSGIKACTGQWAVARQTSGPDAPQLANWRVSDTLILPRPCSRAFVDSVSVRLAKHACIVSV